MSQSLDSLPTTAGDNQLAEEHETCNDQVVPEVSPTTPRPTRTHEEDCSPFVSYGGTIQGY